MEYKEKLLIQAFGFLQTIGGAERMCEAGKKPSEVMTEEYMEEIEDYLEEWIPSAHETMCPIDDVDNCLEAEKLLYNFFFNEIIEIMG